MKTFIAIMLTSVLFFSCRSGPKDNTSRLQEEPAASKNDLNDNSVTWHFDSSPSEQDPAMPLTSIAVTINHRKIQVVKQAPGEYSPMNLEERASWKVPETASSACFGGYGGLYRVIYVEKQKNKVHIKEAWNDAESNVEGWSDIKILKTFTNAELNL